MGGRGGRGGFRFYIDLELGKTLKIPRMVIAIGDSPTSEENEKIPPIQIKGEHYANARF